MIIKYSEGAIVSVLDEEDLTEEQKKSAKNLSKQPVKKAVEEIESRKSENN